MTARQLSTSDGRTMRDYQMVGTAYAVDRRRSINGDEMGLGKTVQALSALETAGAYPAVVVCTKGMKETWRREAHTWLPRGRTVAVIDGIKPRIIGADLTIVNFDVLYAHLGTIKGVRGLVIDEFHHIKTADLDPDGKHKTRRTGAVAQLAATVPDDGMILMLSGTPFLNRPSELVSPLLMLGYLSEDRLQPNSAEAFKWRFCGPSTGLGGRRTFFGSSNEKALSDWLRKTCMIRRLKADVLSELKPKERYKVAAAMTAADWWRYQELAREAALAACPPKEPDLDAGDAAWDAFENDPDRLGRGAELVYLNKLRELVGRAKINRALQWITRFCESGKSLVVFADHVEVQEGILKALAGVGITTASLLGGMSARETERQKARFQARQAQVIVCSLRAAREGHTLTAASDVLFAEFGWTAAEHDQAEDRCHRIGQQESVTCYYLIATGHDGETTIDGWSWELIERKRRVFDLVMNKPGEAAVAELESIAAELIKMLTEAYTSTGDGATGET